MTHFLFVDGIFIFCDGSRRDANKLKEILDLQCTTTCTTINMKKSSICFYDLEEHVFLQSPIILISTLQKREGLKCLWNDN
jgi:hypothetical protein